MLRPCFSYVLPGPGRSVVQGVALGKDDLGAYFGQVAHVAEKDVTLDHGVSSGAVSLQITSFG